MNCPNCGKPVEITSAKSLPENLRPLSPWAYFGYSLLFAIPVVGLVLLIVFSFSRANYNRRSFARSYFCSYIILGTFLLVFWIVLLATGLSAELLYYLS